MRKPEINSVGSTPYPEGMWPGQDCPEGKQLYMKDIRNWHRFQFNFEVCYHKQAMTCKHALVSTATGPFGDLHLEIDCQVYTPTSQNNVC